MEAWDAEWKSKLVGLRAHAAAHGRLPPLHDPGLGGWVCQQRALKRVWDAGWGGSTMTPARVAALEGVPGWAWEAEVDVEARFRERLAELRAYVAHNAQLPPHGDAAGLSRFVDKRRAAKRAMDAGRKSTLTPAHAAALETVPGWTWAADA